MERKYKHQNTVCILSEHAGFVKRVDMLKDGTQAGFCLSLFSTGQEKPLRQIVLNKSEMRNLITYMKQHKELLEGKPDENEKFKRDMIQQSHSSSMEDREKERQLW